MKTNKQIAKFATIALFTCFIVTFIISDIYILAHANHDHNHDGIGGSCTVCAHIQSAENLLKQLAMASKSMSFIIVGLFFMATFLYVVSSLEIYSTLVNLKIRMND